MPPDLDNENLNKNKFAFPHFRLMHELSLPCGEVPRAATINQEKIFFFN